MGTIIRNIQIAALLAVAATSAAAQPIADSNASTSVFGRLSSYRDFCLERHEKQYLLCLNHPMDAIVEAAIREIARVKLTQPKCSSSAIEDRLEDLSIHGNTASIRFKAALAKMLFDSPELFVDFADRDYQTAKEMFTEISRRLEQTVLFSEL